MTSQRDRDPLHESNDPDAGADRIDADINGHTSGEVAVGKGILQVKENRGVILFGTSDPSSTSQRRPRWGLVGSVGLVAVVSAVVAIALAYPRPASLSASLNPIVFDSVRAGETSFPKEVWIHNPGNLTVPVRDVDVLGDAFRLESETCERTHDLKPEGKCVVQVAFAPREPGELSGRIRVLSDEGEVVAEVELRGRGLEGIRDSVIVEAPPPPRVVPRGRAVIAVEGTADVGEVPIGTLKRIVLQIANHGEVDLRIRSAHFEGEADQFFIVTPCSRIVARATCMLSVDFQPLRAGSHFARLVLEHNATQTLTEVHFSGTGVVPPQPMLYVPPGSVYFGNPYVDSTVIREIVLSNVGNAPMSVLVDVIPLGRSFSISGETCSVEPVVPSDQCRVKVSYTPSEEGPDSAELHVRAGAGGASVIPLTGRARLRPATASVEPQLVEYSLTAGATAATRHTVRVTNSGKVALRIDSVSLSPRPGPFQIVRDDCSFRRPFAESQSCLLVIDFRAPEVGSYTGRLAIYANTQYGMMSVALHGEVAASVQVEEAEPKAEPEIPKEEQDAPKASSQQLDNGNPPSEGTTP